jgi:hypothetical protein
MMIHSAFSPLLASTLGVLMVMATGVAAPADAAEPDDPKPVMACEQQGALPAMPPMTSRPIQIHECTSFSGGAMAGEVGKQWREQAGHAPFGGAQAPKVTLRASCGAGALAVCRTTLPGSDVVVSRYFYVADVGAGGLAGLRKTCEASGRGVKGATPGRWTQF